MADIANLAPSIPTGLNFKYVYSFEYRKQLPVWLQMDDTYHSDVKRYAQRYLAPPPGLFQEDLVKNQEIQASVQGLKVPVAEGSGWPAAAKSFALGGFEPELVSRTLKGFSSLISEHEAVVKIPSSMEYLLEDATKDSLSLQRVFLNTVNNTLLKGRTPLYLDIDEQGRIVIVQYPPESLIYWRRKDAGPDNSLFQYAVLREYIPNPDIRLGTHGSHLEYLEVYLELYLDDDGIFNVKKYTQTTSQGYIEEDVTPNYRGKTLDFIPLVAIGSTDNTPDVDIPPLLGIANCVTQIYSLGCILNHAETKSAVPTMFMTGVDLENAPSVTGASVVLTLPDYQSRVGYTTTDTSAMTHIQSRMEDFYNQAQELGASLLGSRKNGTESGEALRLRQASSTATLKSVVDNVGYGFEYLLQMCAIWINENPKEVKFNPNSEFSTFALTANETVALVQSWQSGAISHSTLLDNFRRAGMLQAGDTIEDEKERLDDPDEIYVESCGCKPQPNKSNSNSNLNEIDIAENIQNLGMNKAI